MSHSSSWQRSISSVGSSFDMPMLGSSFARLRAPGFKHLPLDSCWTNKEENVIYYLNTYMDGERQYTNALYESEYFGPGALMLDRVKDDDSSSECGLQVVQECEHEEQAVVPDLVDNTIADVLWAQHVEQIISASSTSDHVQSELDNMWTEDTSSESVSLWEDDARACIGSSEKIIIVKFSRSVQDLFPKCLHTGQELEPVRAAAKEHGQTCILNSGASIFVYPNQYMGITSTLKNFELRRHHVVVSDAFLPLVYNEIIKIPSKSNIKPVDWKLFAIFDDETELLCVVERTFYKAVSPLCNSDGVTQSTSEAHGYPNIRRHMPR